MWFWPVNGMTELVSGMSAPQFREKYSRVRRSEQFKWCLHFILIDVRCFHVDPVISSLIPVGMPPQVQDHRTTLSTHRWRWDCQPYMPAAHCPQEYFRSPFLCSYTQTYLNIRHSTLGYNFKFKHRRFRTFSIQSLAANSGCPLVRVKFRHP
jgi:hypothetical protein